MKSIFALAAFFIAGCAPVDTTPVKVETEAEIEKSRCRTRIGSPGSPVAMVDCPR